MSVEDRIASLEAALQQAAAAHTISAERARVAEVPETPGRLAQVSSRWADLVAEQHSRPGVEALLFQGPDVYASLQHLLEAKALAARGSPLLQAVAFRKFTRGVRVRDKALASGICQ